MNKPKILLLSGYDAASHQHWRQSLESNLTCFDWTVIKLPDRYFSWRVRGNSLTFGFEFRELLTQDYDCLIVTSMVDLSSLRGFVPRLANLPTLVYFHENQFAYPMSGEQKNKQTLNANRVGHQLTSIYTALCADQILFNSIYNQTTFFEGANKLLSKLPDGIPHGLLTHTRKNSRVLAVPISDQLQTLKAARRKASVKTKPIEIVWNHRWEYDKQPDVFFAAIKRLKEAGVDFNLHILGQSFRKKPPCFADAKIEFKQAIITWGFQPLEKYQEILSQADIVVSTARHDFQGLSMLEAIACGCTPVAPNRVAYPEYIHSDNLYQDAPKETEPEYLYHKLLETIERKQLKVNKSIRHDSHKSISEYFEQHLIACYKKKITQLISLNTHQFKPLNKR